VSPEDLVRRLVRQVWNGGDLEVLDELFAATFDHGGRPDDVAGLRAWHAQDAATWAEPAYEVVDLFAGGDRVALRWRCTARQVGTWGPVPPTGRTATWDGVHLFTVRDGRITAMWAMADVFGKAASLGATLTPPG